jgi:branched-chain amino acid transport system ATP-binding protein
MTTTAPPATDTAAPTLKIDGLTSGYGATTVLWDINLEVPPSSVVALLGPNGAGKTTLLRTASGLLPTRRGHIYMDGQDVTRRRMDEMARAGLCHLPEGRGIFPSLTVKENLILFSPRGKQAESLERAAAAFPELSGRMRQTARSLSGGEQQMLSIVRAYISSPRLVLVDEASMGLAPLVVDRIFEFLDGIAKQGTALLLVEQYLYRALDLADLVYILNRGRIVYQGTPAQVRDEDVFDRYMGPDSGSTL